ncbi:MAG: DNA primase [Candidatus Micrarchaeota archaeon]|nr:DNA primase [Candidatus Micrarchaeota archaeon]
MAKTYIDIVKYMVEARFEISGLAEKPDIIGAVFGQTEGLLGGGLDLRELQKNGKIGRIEIEASSQGNKTYGKLFLPSSLGRVETCILGATIESVDRVGPFETVFKVNKIEDTRNEKRRKIVARAKDLLKTLITTEMPDSKEISELVETDVKSSVVTTFGQDNLPAGPDVEEENEVILVEGRADVINLLKNDITNCIAVGGATGKIPQTIIDLTKSKEATLFLDGDRGGDMILRGLLNVCDIDYVVRAPDGKEVEELTRKDIIKALRAKVPIDQVIPRLNGGSHRGHYQEQRRDRFQQQHQQREMRVEQQVQQQSRHEVRLGGAPRQQERDRSILSPSEISRKMLSKEDAKAAVEPINVDPELGIKDINHEDPSGMDAIKSIDDRAAAEPEQRYMDSLTELHNTLRGRLYDKNSNVISEVPIRELIQTVQDTDGISAIVFDGIITQRLIELANKRRVKSIYGIRAGQVSRMFEGMLLYTKEQGKLAN